MLQDRNPPPVKAIWQRIYAALDKDKPDFAESVLGYLGKADRAPVKAWLQARQNPGDYLQSGALTADNPLNRRILVNLLLKWSKDDTVAAMNHWLLVRDTYRFYSDRFYETTRALVLRSAYRRLARSLRLVGYNADSRRRSGTKGMACPGRLVPAGLVAGHSQYSSVTERRAAGRSLGLLGGTGPAERWP